MYLKSKFAPIFLPVGPLTDFYSTVEGVFSWLSQKPIPEIETHEIFYAETFRPQYIHADFIQIKPSLN